VTQSAKYAINGDYTQRCREYEYEPISGEFTAELIYRISLSYTPVIDWQQLSGDEWENLPSPILPIWVPYCEDSFCDDGCDEDGIIYLNRAETSYAMFGRKFVERQLDGRPELTQMRDLYHSLFKLQNRGHQEFFVSFALIEQIQCQYDEPFDFEKFKLIADKPDTPFLVVSLYENAELLFDWERDRYITLTGYSGKKITILTDF